MVLQATKFKIIEHSLFDRPIIYKVVDHDGHMIAKINGAHNVPVVQKLLTYEQTFSELRTICRNRLIAILKQLKGCQGSIQATCRTYAETRFDEILAMLKDQLQQAPVELVSTIGGEAVQIVKAL